MLYNVALTFWQSDFFCGQIKQLKWERHRIRQGDAMFYSMLFKGVYFNSFDWKNKGIKLLWHDLKCQFKVKHFSPAARNQFGVGFIFIAKNVTFLSKKSEFYLFFQLEDSFCGIFDRSSWIFDFYVQQFSSAIFISKRVLFQSVRKNSIISCLETGKNVHGSHETSRSNSHRKMIPSLS